MWCKVHGHWGGERERLDSLKVHGHWRERQRQTETGIGKGERERLKVHGHWEGFLFCTAVVFPQPPTPWASSCLGFSTLFMLYCLVSSWPGQLQQFPVILPNVAESFSRTEAQQHSMGLLPVILSPACQDTAPSRHSLAQGHPPCVSCTDLTLCSSGGASGEHSGQGTGCCGLQRLLKGCSFCAWVACRALEIQLAADKEYLS